MFIDKIIFEPSMSLTSNINSFVITTNIFEDENKQMTDVSLKFNEVPYT